MIVTFIYTIAHYITNTFLTAQVKPKLIPVKVVNKGKRNTY